mgnify:CR=1 FL=1
MNLLDIDNLHVKLEDEDRDIIRGLSLTVKPGEVHAIMGPNGSGKSNVVDAIAWVLGAQAPSAVRSQKMDDVIFAGTTKRSALGRAEVSLTIDNGSGILPIEFSEVTITRTLFRSGDSEYAINGVPCRLLDIHEYLLERGVKLEGITGTRYMYHDPCHSPMKTHSPLKVVNALMSAPVALNERCCGESGTLSVTRPDISTQVRFRKEEEMKRDVARTGLISPNITTAISILPQNR